jgi:hypothetical protein
MKLSLALLASASAQLTHRSRDEIEDTFVVVPDGYDGSFENWNTTQIVAENEDDDIFQEFEQNYYHMTSDVGRADFSEEEKSFIKKFKLMKHMILYLQQIPLFGKFCFYGCHCFSKGPMHLLEDAGNGAPLDAADTSCRSHGRCHYCAQKDFGEEKCSVTRPYSFSAKQDAVTGVRFIECRNTEGSCKRSICECDKALAYDLADNENTWNILHHQRWGQFDQEANCRSATARAADRGERISEPEEGCCGEYPRRFPFHLDNGYGVVRRCCNGKTYDPNVLECCESMELKTLGACPIY